MAQSVSTLTKLQRQSFPGDDKDPATIYDLRKIQDSIANSVDPVVQFLTQFQSDQANTNAAINGNLALYQLLSGKDVAGGYVGRDSNNRLAIAAANLTEVVPASPVANRDYAGMLPHPISSTALSGASTTISLPGDTRYPHLIILLRNVLPATLSDELWMRINDGSGISTAASYELQGVAQGGGGATNVNLGGQTKFILSGGITVSNASTKGVSGMIVLSDPGETSHHKQGVQNLVFYRGASAVLITHTAGFQYQGSTTAWTQIQFLFSTGNITSGTCDIYGMLAV